jgi:hypothetical protein
LAIVGALAFVIIAAVISALIIYRKFKKWKAAKEGKQQGMIDLNPYKTPILAEKQ